MKKILILAISLVCLTIGVISSILSFLLGILYFWFQIKEKKK